VLGIAPLYPDPWPLARDSRVEFTMRHLGLATFGGSFERVAGSVRVDTAHVLRRLELTVDAASLTTRSPERDARLRAIGIFGDDEHPSLHFRSDWTYEKGGGREGVQGTLTMLGRTHVVQLVAEPTRVTLDVTGRRWLDATVAGTIDRRDWGVAVHPVLETGGLLLGHEVHVRLRLRAAIPGVKPARATG
jgi:polyisoprenoid-binding protein YceI